MDENQRTMLEKIRGKALAHYIAATIALGGGAAALQSCQEQNINIDLNNEEIKKLLTQMIQLQQQTNEYLKNLDSSNKELVQLVKDIYAQTAEIISILNQVNSGIMDINVNSCCKAQPCLEIYSVTAVFLMMIPLLFCRRYRL